MDAAVIRAADQWRGITVGEFERRQLHAIRAELNRAHADRVASVVAPKRRSRFENCERTDDRVGTRCRFGRR